LQVCCQPWYEEQCILYVDEMTASGRSGRQRPALPPSGIWAPLTRATPARPSKQQPRWLDPLRRGRAAPGQSRWGASDRSRRDLLSRRSEHLRRDADFPPLRGLRDNGPADGHRRLAPSARLRLPRNSGKSLSGGEMLVADTKRVCRTVRPRYPPRGRGLLDHAWRGSGNVLPVMWATAAVRTSYAPRPDGSG